MTVKIKIVEVNLQQHSLVARFYTDIVTELDLCSQFDEQTVPDPDNEGQTKVVRVPKLTATGEIARCSTDRSIDIPVPAPADLLAYLKPYAVRVGEWLATQEAVRNPAVNTSLSDAIALLGQEVDVDTTPAAPPAVPPQVTMRQARLALFGAGLLSTVEAAIDAMPEPNKTAARVTWDYSSVVDRNQTLVLQLAAGLGLSSAQVDQLFVTAAGL